jgi:hypothetical protein
MTRKGKIARLPRSIRELLNQRLDEGEPATRLVEWLNELGEVKDVLEVEFDGRPINDQNLTDWKQGGFIDWQQRQESREWARAMIDGAEEVADLAEEAGAMPFSNSLAAAAALTLGKLMHGLASDALSDSDKRDDLLRVLSELRRLRRDDLEAASRRYSLEQDLQRDY